MSNYLKGVFWGLLTGLTVGFLFGQSFATCHGH